MDAFVFVLKIKKTTTNSAHLAANVMSAWQMQTQVRLAEWAWSTTAACEPLQTDYTHKGGTIFN